MVQGIRSETFDMAFTVAQFIHQAIGSTGFLVVCHVELGKDALLGIGQARPRRLKPSHVLNGLAIALPQDVQLIDLCCKLVGSSLRVSCRRHPGKLRPSWGGHLGIHVLDFLRGVIDDKPHVFVVTDGGYSSGVLVDIF